MAPISLFGKQRFKNLVFLMLDLCKDIRTLMLSNGTARAQVPRLRGLFLGVNPKREPQLLEAL